MLAKMSQEIGNYSLYGIVTTILLLMTLSGKTLYCMIHVLNGKGQETFKMPMVDRIFTWIDATFIEVLILDVGMLIALIVGLVLRYFYYKDEREFIKKYKVKGKTGFWGSFRTLNNDRDYPDMDD